MDYGGGVTEMLAIPTWVFSTGMASQNCPELSNPESSFYQYLMQAVLGEEM